MEFLRFGSSIPGSYWGCCAICIIQNFKFDPDEKASIELVCGDEGQPIEGLFAGLTYREIFETRLRIGTFSTDDMPNHAFLATMTEGQLDSDNGRKWLQILKENGFEFVRTVDNSVYSGTELQNDVYPCYSINQNHIFGLFRNIGSGAVKDPLKPPAQWTDLEGGCKNAVDFVTETQQEELVKDQQKYHRKQWDKIGYPVLYTKDEVIAAGAPVTLAGVRSKMPQQLESCRQRVIDSNKQSSPAPFSSGDAALASI